jgi:hypothetical protein
MTPDILNDTANRIACIVKNTGSVEVDDGRVEEQVELLFLLLITMFILIVIVLLKKVSI